MQIIGKRKTFYSQRIPESRYAKKQTADIDILATSTNGDKKSCRIISRSLSKIRKLDQLSQFK